jgi:hypothetical protein
MIKIRTRILALQVVSWRRSNRLFLATFAGTLATVYIFILLVDPYGVVPFDRPMMSVQRQMYPQILRTGRYDSIVVGTSTSKLLDPLALDHALGGHFATFAMRSATAWEQVQFVDYFRRTVAAPKAVVIGLDHEWCLRSSAAPAREKEFPSWAYDDNRWNDFLYMLNSPTLEIASRTVSGMLGWAPEWVRDDGFEIFVPPDSTYDLARARGHLYGPTPPPLDLPPMSETERDTITSEALRWLDDSLAGLPATTRKVLMFLPLHAHWLPVAGSAGEAREAECKSRVAAIARRRGATLVDWRIVSSLTTDDSHFWDPLHYRLPIAYGLIDDLEHIVNEGRESPDGSYRILVR